MFTKIYCILNNILNYYSKPQIKYTRIKFINPIYNQYNSKFLNKKSINTFQNL